MRTFHCILFTDRGSPPALALILASNATRARGFALRELHKTQAARVELREGGRLIWVKRRRLKASLARRRGRK